MVKIHICIGSACHLKGSYNVIGAFQQEIEDRGLSEEVEVCGTFCLGHCGENVSIKVEDEYFGLTAQEVPSFFENEIVPRIS